MSVRVLVADDHAVVRDGLRLILQTQPDLEVVGEAATGAEAVRLTGKLEPDVVVMDIAMPELDGIEATARILAARPQTRVIILSMHATSEHIYRALKTGARGYVLKESAGTEVVAAVRAVCAGSRYLSHKIADVVIDSYTSDRDPDALRSPLERLSDRERQILTLVVEGKTSAEIGKLLFLSPKSVDTYRSRMMAKLGVGDVVSLVKFAIQHGLTTLE
jgi:DNA-binding NarL/FixJ family response regulator